VVPDPARFREPRSDLFYPEHEKEEYGFRPLPSTPADEWVRWTSIYRRHPLQAFICTIFFGVYGYAAVAFPFRLKHLVNRRLRSGAVRVVALAGGSIAALLAPLMFAAGLLFINMMYGGTELTLLPGPVGFGLGALCGVLVWLWPVKANGMARR
jgi:hypothetical protein